MAAKVEAPRERGLKSRVPISTTISIEAREKLNEIHEATQIPMSKLLDEAIKDLVVKYERRLAILAEN